MTRALLLLVIGLSAVGVAGDVLLKRASGLARPFASAAFLGGVALYVLTTFGWVLALRRLELAKVGAIYSVATVVLLAVSGAVLFHERLDTAECLGLALAVAALALLSRHA